MKKLIAGNWKMNGDRAGIEALANQVSQGIVREPSLLNACDFLVCPSFIHITMVGEKISNTPVLLGAQDCSDHDNGAYTGDISASMLSDIGCKFVILGHSERRQYHQEKNEYIRAKVKTAVKNGLCVILCVGETETQRDFGQAVKIVIEQLEGGIPENGVTASNLVIAYEPVWAIGTGKIPTVEDVTEIHRAIRDKLKEMLADGANMRILYGGSVKADNAAQLLNIENVNGALIGGASLKADEFLSIARAVQ